MEKTTISNRSTKLFTLSAIYQATEALLGKSKGDELNTQDDTLACAYWSRLGEIIPEWQLMIARQANAAHLRGEYIHVHGVALHALGIVGHALVAAYPESWQTQVAPLADVDWRRTNTQLWEGRAMQHGKMSKAGHCVHLTANALKQALGLPLATDEQELEQLVTPPARERSMQ